MFGLLLAEAIGHAEGVVIVTFAVHIPPAWSPGVWFFGGDGPVLVRVAWGLVMRGIVEART